MSWLDRLGRTLGVRRPATPARIRATALDRRQIGLAVAVLVVAVPLALMLAVDQSVAIAFRDGSPGFRNAMEAVTRFGESQWVLVPSAVVALSAFVAASREPQPLRRSALRWIGQTNLFVFVVVALSGIGVNVIKVIIGRARPRVFFGDGFFGVDPLTFGSAYASFPSGHTATAFAFAIAVGMIARRTRPFLFAFAALIALSRVAITAHWVGDTVAAAGLALVIALCVRHWFATRGLAFTIRADGQTVLTPSGRLVLAAARRLLKRHQLHDRPERTA
ncbi:MAG: phosphatase PAP2 family protein [Alphaproteobacteria bacterium]|nr:phosphatase PAP2 family protein [Alphaproteobacteria bacterium]